MRTPTGSHLPARAAAVVLALAAHWSAAAGAEPPAAPLATVAVGGAAASPRVAYDGVVQAVRQTALAAQVPGAVVALQARAGDRVQAGQVLARLDARAAGQSAAAGAAQVRAAQAAQEVATRDFERQQQLFDKGYISRAALDRAESQFKSARAEAAAQTSSAGAAQTQTDFYVIRAPYAGVVSEVNVVLGDMAMPGKPLLTVYDPSALRVSASVPQSVVARLAKDPAPSVEVAGATGAIVPGRWQLLPAVDPATHTQELRLDLPPDATGIAPGQFARLWLQVDGGAQQRLAVPAQALVRRAELAAVYVVGADGKPALRQVRTGRTDAGQVDLLSGVSAGERVALDPQAAARIR